MQRSPPAHARRRAARRAGTDRGSRSRTVCIAALLRRRALAHAVDARSAMTTMPTPGDRRRSGVERAAEPGQPGSHAERREQQRIDEDFESRARRALDVRHHRHAGAAVVAALDQRQRPEMRRRPDEDDGEQRRGSSSADVARRRGLADHRRQRAGGAADHDVLRRRALQPHRVDDDIEEDGEGEQRRRRASWSARPSVQHREQRQRQAEGAAPRRGSMRPAGIGRMRVRAISASMSASYHMLSAPEAPAPTAIASSAAKPITGCSGRGAQQHAGERGEHDERHHARLQQREIIATAPRRDARRRPSSR